MRATEVTAFYFPANHCLAPERIRVPLVDGEPGIRAILKGHPFTATQTTFVHIGHHTFRISYRVGPQFLINKSLRRIVGAVGWRGDLIVTSIGARQQYKGILYGRARRLAMRAVEVYVAFVFSFPDCHRPPFSFLTQFHVTGELKPELHASELNPAGQPPFLHLVPLPCPGANAGNALPPQPQQQGVAN
jgi:hypothetical protein